MKKKVNFMMLTLIVAITSLSLTSCDKADDVENYYIELLSVATNCIDVNGESIAPAIKQNWVLDVANSGERFAIGKTTYDSAIDAFDRSITNMKTGYAEAYVGKNLLPQDGAFELLLALVSKSGSRIKTATIRVTNSGVY